MPDEPPVDSIGARLLRDDEEAWAVVLAEILPRARAAIRRKFGPIRRSFDDEDAVNSANRTILRRLKEDLLAGRLNSWDDFEGLLVLVASRKFIDSLRKTKAEGKREARFQADREQGGAGNAAESAVLKDLYQAGWDRAMDEFMSSLLDALKDPTERVVFLNKLNGFNEKEIAERVEAEVGERMTKFMVRDVWREIRARLNRLFPELPEGLFD